MRQYNPRYYSYCRSLGMTPEEEKERRGSEGMLGFTEWNTSMRRVFREEEGFCPSAILADVDQLLFEQRMWMTKEGREDKYDRWLAKRARLQARKEKGDGKRKVRLKDLTAWPHCTATVGLSYRAAVGTIRVVSRRWVHKNTAMIITARYRSLSGRESVDDYYWPRIGATK